ncbi:protein XRP2-like isoform X1 [Mizuhopecten yessoensis]|uniref:protein XRP2-like isoform X1 n=1 Tax=Mizuhopecten yessoensis TaxID=6573 RepID=UPI000B45F1E2|nr:protein XRP2-like isoform X1 [Mizuhopecten yessoensis]
MGCLFAKFSFFRPRHHAELQEEATPKYSWERREKLNLQDYTFDGHKDATLGRTPGQVNGQMFVIQNCENCNIYIYDNLSTVTIDDCVNCTIFMGPIAESVFIRDCKNLKLGIVCQQFRTRDCSKIETFLFCTSQPIIEDSSGMKFGCFTYFYPELEDQFKAAGMSLFNNNWSKIHDFSQDPSENHYSYIPEDVKIEDVLPLSLAEQFSAMQIDFSVGKSVVPRTLGLRRKAADESCLLVFFNDGSAIDRVRKYMHIMSQNQPSCVLVQTKEIDMQPQDAQRVFGTDAYQSLVQQGAVIGLEYNGEDSINLCQVELVEFMKGTTGLVFISQSRALADKQIEDFYNFAEMQMTM